MEKVYDTKFTTFLTRAYLKHDLKDPLSLGFDISYMLMILTALVFSILHLCNIFNTPILIIEIVIVAFFAFEWFTRFSLAIKEFYEIDVLHSRIKFMVNYESIIDVACLITFIVLIALKEEPNVYYLSMVHLLRVFKLNKYFRSYFKKKEKKESL